MRRFLVPVGIFLSLLAFTASGVKARQGQVTPDHSSETVVVSATPESEVQILSPKPGQALQGNVPVVVDTTAQGFKSVELDFGYEEDRIGTWFLIYQGIQPVTGTMLVLWDTGTITDGNYTLRMIVTYTDGSQKTALVSGVRVRNYTPVETSTPTPPLPTATPAPARTPTASPAPTVTTRPANPTSTPLSANPAELGNMDILTSAGKGALAIVGLFLLGGIYTIARSNGRRK